MNLKNVKLWGLGALVSISNLAHAQSNDSLAARLEELEQKILVIERLREIEQEDAKAAAAKAPKVSAGEGGFGLSSADGTYSIKFRNYVQGQALFYNSNVGVTSTSANPNVTTGTPAFNAFSIKRLHSDLGGSLGTPLEYRVHINFGGGAVDLLDVNLDWKILPEFSLRVGKFKPPTGLERLIASPRAPFIEGSFVTALQPNRDLGAQAFGSVGNGLVEYQVGVFNGGRDGQNNAGDNNSEKDFYARVFSHPFVATGSDLLSGLGVGLSGSHGTPAPVAANLPSYGTGRQTVFSYAAADTSVGTVVRLSPQAYWYTGPFGLIAEYTRTTQSVRRAYTAAAAPTTRLAEDELTHGAWAVTASYFLTGEKNTYKNIKVKKANTFPSLEGIGAVELLVRVHALDIDDQAFAPLGSVNLTQSHADPAKSVSEALGAGLAAKWYLNSNVNLFLAYEVTRFTGGLGTSARAPSTTPALTTAAAVPSDREAEQVVSAAFNVSF